MSLNKTALKQALAKAFKDQVTKTTNPDAAFEDIAIQISDAIDNYIRTITITSLPVLTSPSGPVSGNITNTVS